MKPEQGALIGAVAGIVTALVGAVLGMIFGAGNAALMQLLQSSPQLADQLGDFGVQLAAVGGFSFFGLMCNLVFYTAFGAIGRLIGAAIFKPKASSAM